MLRIRERYKTGKCRQRGFVKLRRVGRQGLFRFPSNGKAYCKCIYDGRQNVPCVVSIPFKRESLSKVWVSWSDFQSDYHVSIPFKRESLYKVIANKDKVESISKFPFPSNGKAYPKRHAARRDTEQPDESKFPFPSNGKAYPKQTWETSQRKIQLV